MKTYLTFYTFFEEKIYSKVTYNKYSASNKWQNIIKQYNIIIFNILEHSII